MAEDKHAKQSESADAPPAASGGGGKLPVILGVLNLLLILGIGAVVFLQFQKDKKRESVADIQPEAEHAAAAGGEHGGGEHGEAKKEGEHGGGEHGEAKKEGEHGGGEHGGESKSAESKNFINLDQFTVNLSTSVGTPPRFARVVISVEVSSGEAGTEITQKMAPVRNAIIDLFNSKRPADLQTGEGRNFLKEEIKNALNGFLVTGKVKGVFFSNFAVSS